MELRNRRLVLLLALCALFIGASAAQAQVTYQITTTPTFVINTGRAEAIGSVRLTPINTGTPTVASTIDFLFEATPCDNNTATGIVLNLGGVYFGTTTAIVAVTNSSSGCVVSVSVPAGVIPVSTTGGDYIELQGVRARIDLSPASTIGVDVNVRMNATPSSATLFTTPSTARVATSQDGLVVTITNTLILVCAQVATAPRVRAQEGFNGAFVQHVAAGTGPRAGLLPANPRPLFGGTNNTQVHINVGALPAGVALTWPAIVTSTSVSGAGFPGGFVSYLELITGTNATDIVYSYVTADQGVSDLNTERFDINPAVTLTQPVSLGTANAAANLHPPLQPGDATSLTTGPFGTTTTSGAGVAVRPRFNDPLDPSPARPLVTVSPCVTNLLFPYTANVASFDTGMAIANTSSDPFDPLFTSSTVGSATWTGWRTVRQSGTCTLTGFQADTGASVTFTTPTVASGTTYRTLLSSADNPVFNGFVGYIIARCNFQFAHGFAFIVDGYGLSAPRVAEGYVALVIPDPVVTGVGRFTGAAPALATTGEGLNQ